MLKTGLATAAASMLFTSAIVAPASAQTQLITNGDFEAGTFAGWTTTTQAGSNGALFIATPGANTPISGYATAANASGGNFYALTDQGGGGGYALAQTFAVATGTTALNLTFQLFANNQAGVDITPNTLDYTAGSNQQVRVDLLVAGADPFSVAAGDVVTNFYLGSDGSGANPYTSYSFNLLPFVTAGNSYTLRFAETDNQLYFHMGVDNVSLLSTAGGVPEPATWALMILGMGAVGGAMRRRSATKATVRFA